MMLWMTLLFVGLIVLIFASFIVHTRWQKHSLKGSAKAEILRKWQQATMQADVHRRIIEADAVLDATLTKLGYRGSLGEKLKKAGAYIPELDAVWRAHKLRNRIAHEAGSTVTAAEAVAAVRAIGLAIEKFTR